MSSMIRDACTNCKFSWMTHKSIGPEDFDDMFECRRNAPPASFFDDNKLGEREDEQSLLAIWPSVNGGDWCGEHQRRDEGREQMGVY